MIKVRIDNRDFEASNGDTVLDVASRAGIDIPTLCHKSGMPHYSSCMVCMVKDKKKNSFIPSCSALVQEGMDIDSSGEDVIALRRKALELLLSEHRAECEAPCRVVCPAGYNIPLMNRLLSAGNSEGAFELVESEVQSSPIACIDCKAYCENACRRKKIDIPISIRNIKLFIWQEISKNATSTTETKIETESKQAKKQKYFNSHIGKLETAELQEWLKECKGETQRIREIPDFQGAGDEAQSCMHCDCRAVDNCELRKLSHTYSIHDPNGKLINFPIEKKINHNTGLIFENAKCIKCGLCVRLCENNIDEPGLCFINKGFISIISEPITMGFDDILKTRSKEVIDICPTGALSDLNNDK